MELWILMTADAWHHFSLSLSSEVGAEPLCGPTSWRVVCKSAHRREKLPGERTKARTVSLSKCFSDSPFPFSHTQEAKAGGS